MCLARVAPRLTANLGRTRSRFCYWIPPEVPHDRQSCRNSTLARAVSGIAARNRLVGLVLALAVAVTSVELRAEPVPVRYTEGLVHGFLVLRTLDGRAIADGELSQVASGVQVTSRLTFRFRDGSLHDETAVFTQRELFRLVSCRPIWQTG